MPLFSEIDNRGNELFVTLTYPKEISKKEYINIGCKKIFLKNEVVFVAIKNGMHQEKGFAYFSKKISKYAPKNGDHVKELHNSIFNFFRLSNQ